MASAVPPPLSCDREYLVDPARIICLLRRLSHACQDTMKGPPGLASGVLLSGICERLRTTAIILPWGETRISSGKPAPKT